MVHVGTSRAGTASLDRDSRLAGPDGWLCHRGSGCSEDSGSDISSDPSYRWQRNGGVHLSKVIHLCD